MSLSQPEMSVPRPERNAEPQPGAAPALQFGSLPKLLEAHRNLLAQLGDFDVWTEEGDARTEDSSPPAQLPSALRQQIIAFVHRGAATGRVLSDREERTVAQSVVNFWVSWLDSAVPPEQESGGQRRDAPRRPKSVPFTQTVLQPFNQKEAEARGDALDALLSKLDDEPRTVARRLLLRFVHLRPDNDRFDPVPTVRAALQDIGPTEQIEAILQLLLSAGLVRSTPADIRELDRLELAFPEIVNTSDEYQSVEPERLAFREHAKQWRAKQHAAVESEASLTEARLYHDKNTVERDFLFACLELENYKKKRLRKQLRYWIAAAVGLAALLAIAIYLGIVAYQQSARAESEKTQAERETARAESEKARADSARDTVIAGSQLDLGNTIEAVRFASSALRATRNDPPLDAQVTLQRALSSLPEQIGAKQLPHGKRCKQLRAPPGPDADSYSLLFDDLSVEVWDVQAPKVLSRVPPPPSGVEIGKPDPTLADDGAHLLRRCGDTVEIWSTRPAVKVGTYPVPKNARVVFAEGGTQFAYSTLDRSLAVWGLQQNAPALITCFDNVKDLSISRRGAFVSVLTKHNSLNIFRVADKHPVSGLGFAFPVEPAHFGPDERSFAVATSADSFLVGLWRRVEQLFGVAASAETPEEGPDADIRPHTFWRIDRAKARARRLMAANLPSAPLFASDGGIFAVQVPGLRYRTIRLYNAVSGQLTSEFIIPPGSRLKGISPAGTYVAVSVRNLLELWNAAIHEVSSAIPSSYSAQTSGSQEATLIRGPSYESSSFDTPLAFQDDETALIAGGGLLSEWNIASNAAATSFSLNTDRIKDASVTSKGDLLTTDVEYSSPKSDGLRFAIATVRKWQLNPGSVGQNLQSQVVDRANRVRYGAVAPEGEYWITVDGPSELSIRSLMSSNVFKESTGSQKIISAAPGSAAAVASVSDGLLIYRPSDGSQIGKISIPPVPLDRMLEKTRDPVFSVSDDGTMVVFGRQRGGVSLRRIKNSLIEDAGELEGKTTKAVTLNGDGRVVAATFDDGSVAVWDAERRKVLCQFSPTWTFGDLVLSRTGRFLACASGNVSVWDVTQQKEVARLPGSHYWPPRLLFSWDEKQLAVYGGPGGQIGPWSIESLLAIADREVGTDPRSAEKKRLLEHD